MAFFCQKFLFVSIISSELMIFRIDSYSTNQTIIRILVREMDITILLPILSKLVTFLNYWNSVEKFERKCIVCIEIFYCNNVLNLILGSDPSTLFLL